MGTVMYKNAEAAISTGYTNEEQKLATEMMGKIGMLIARTEFKLTRQESGYIRQQQGPKKQATAIGGLQVALKIEQLFELIDDNHNGYLESHEFVSGLKSL